MIDLSDRSTSSQMVPAPTVMCGWFQIICHVPDADVTINNMNVSFSN